MIDVPLKCPTIAYSIPVSSVYPQTSETPKSLEAFVNVILCTKSILLESGKKIIQGDVHTVISEYLKNSNNYSSEINLPKSPSNNFIYGTNLYFFDKNGKSSTKFNLYDKWEVRLEFIITEKLPQVIASIGIISEEGFAITSIWSKPENLAKGNYHVNFTIDLKLATGQLKFVVGLSSRDNTIYYEENLGKISISEISSKEQPIYFPSGDGILLSDSRPSIHRS